MAPIWANETVVIWVVHLYPSDRQHQVRLKVVHGADPNATYKVYGYFGNCSGDLFLGTTDTNSHGVGNATFSYSAPAGQPVWTFTYDSPFTTAQGIETPVVTP
jgi:hypothetical protein